MLVLKDYFRKIKSSPGTEKTEPEVTAAKESSETFNAFAGFGPIVSKTRNQKKAHKTSHLLKRPQRKIFLTVDEAFSDSDFGHYGREMRERDDNYLIYVPVPRQSSTHNILSDAQQVYRTKVITGKNKSNLSIFTGKLF